MKYVLHALLLLCLTATGAYAQTGTVQTKTQLNTEQSTNFPDNNTGQITPAILRQTVVDFIASWQQAPRVNAQAGTTYTVVVDDYGKMVTFANGASIAVSLPQATTTFATFNFMACAKGAGTATITPTTSTINGAATLVLPQGTCSLIVSDGTNYQATWPTVGNNGIVCSLTSGQLACGLTAARQTLPTTSRVTLTAHTGGFSANVSGTYTTPANVLWIEITLIGGGGGGSGGASSGAGGNGGDSCWNTSGAACTTPVYDAGGGVGGGGGGTAGGAGGAISGSGTCNWSAVGGGGFSSAYFTSGSTGGTTGGNSSHGGGAAGSGSNAAGLAGVADTGGGGGGGGAATGNFVGGGGGAGATCYAIINTPAATYTYVVGAAGTGGGSTQAGGAGGGAGATCYAIINNPAATYTYVVGAAGTAGGTTQAGGAGGGGIITVIEHYGS